MLDISKATPSQRMAIEHIGITFCIAGAGSGKTFTLVSKFAYLVDVGFDPARILAITFTNKAANEMTERLTQTLGIKKKDLPWVRTYHSACYQILKDHCRLFGYRPPIQIYTESKQKALFKQIIQELDYDKKYIRPAMGTISRAKNTVRPEVFLSECKLGTVRLFDVYDEYNNRLKKANAVDFDDILLLVYKLFREHPDILEHYQRLFQYILIDEAQDQNNVQNAILALLLGRHADDDPSYVRYFMCCGDDYQNIYGWRGADLAGYLELQSAFGHKTVVVKLEQNFRSKTKIVDLGNALIEFNRMRIKKTCFSLDAGGTIDFRRHSNEYEEADFIARTIRENPDKCPLGDTAVLYRTNAMSRVLEAAMVKHGIPYVLVGGIGFYDRTEIRDIISYLAAAQFPNDMLAFERALSVPKRGIGPATFQKIYEIMENESCDSFRDALVRTVEKKILSPKVTKEISRFLSILDQIQTLSPGQAINHVVQQTDYIGYLKKKYAKDGTSAIEAREDNIAELAFAASKSPSLEAFLEEISLVSETGNEEDRDRVSLMTIHKAKGMEFETIFLAGCEQDTLPHYNALKTDDNNQIENPAALEEERRLMYVAITRAKDWLILNTCFERRGNSRITSQFIDEIAEHLPEDAAN